MMHQYKIIWRRRFSTEENNRYSLSHQRSFEIRCWRRRPGGRYDAIDWVLLLGIDMLHVEGGAVLWLALGLLSVQAGVHATVAILCKECVDGLYPGLSAGRREKSVKQKSTSQKAFLKRQKDFYLTHHDGFSLKCFYFLSQVLVCLWEQRRDLKDNFMV